jgi:DNA gyrase subunit A
MRLSRLTALEHGKLRAELEDLGTRIEQLRKLVDNESERKRHVREELAELTVTFGDGRRTEIVEANEFPLPMGGASGAALVLLSRLGYVKALPGRAGAGLSGAEALAGRVGDFAERAFLCRGQDHMLVVTSGGSAHTIPVSALPLETRSSRGRSLSDYVDLKKNDRVVAVTPVDEWENRYLVTVTRMGQVKRTELSEYANARAGGIIGAGLSDEDSLIAALVTDGSTELVLATRHGQAIRFAEQEARPMGRSARGVRAIDLAAGDEVVSAAAPRRDTSFCVATRLGHAKRLPLTELRLQSRAGRGVTILPDRDKAGDLVGLLELHGEDTIAWELESGDVVFTDADGLRPRGRRAPTSLALRDVAEEPAVRAVRLSAAPRALETKAEPATVPSQPETEPDDSRMQAELELAADR